MSALSDLVLAGRGGIIPYTGTTPVVKTFYGFIPHETLTGVTLTEKGDDTTNVASGKTYYAGHYYAAEASYYTGMTLGNAADGVDIVQTVKQATQWLDYYYIHQFIGLE